MLKFLVISVLLIFLFCFAVWNLVINIVPPFSNYSNPAPTQLISPMLILSPILIGLIAIVFLLKRRED